VRKHAGTSMAWRTEEYEFETKRPAIDLLTGGPELRQVIDRGAPLDEWIAHQDAGADTFRADRVTDLLY
jgi:hypothetical protein